MFDASAKYPYGIIDGLTRHLGSFDQCYRIENRITKGRNDYEDLNSRYCLVEYRYKQKNDLPSYHQKLDYDFDPNGSAWEAIKVLF